MSYSTLSTATVPIHAHHGAQARPTLSNVSYDILREIMSYLDWNIISKKLKLSGDVTLWHRLSHYYLHTILLSSTFSYRHWELAMPIPALKVLKIHHIDTRELTRNVAWLISLPRTLETLDFDFEHSNEIWLRPFHDSEPSLPPHAHLIQSKGFGPIDMASMFPNLHTLSLRKCPASFRNGDPLQVIRLLHPLRNILLDIVWSMPMSYWWLKHLPACLTSLRTEHIAHLRSTFCNFQILIPLPPSLTQLRQSLNSNFYSHLANLPSRVRDSLQDLSWGQPCETDLVDPAQQALLAASIAPFIDKDSLCEYHTAPSRLNPVLDMDALRFMPRNLRQLSFRVVQHGYNVMAGQREWIQGLPCRDTLEELTLSLGYLTTEEFLGIWPPNLSSLSVRMISNNDNFAHLRLPSTLTKLDLSWQDTKSPGPSPIFFGPILESLPRTLLSLKLYPGYWKFKSLQKLPPSLTNFELISNSHHTYLVLIEYPMTLKSVLFSLPVRAVSRERDQEYSVASLPSLEILLLRWSLSGLTRLRIPTWIIRDNQVLLLPRSLVHLEVKVIKITGICFPQDSFLYYDADRVLEALRAILPEAVRERQNLSYLPHVATSEGSIFCGLESNLQLPRSVTRADLKGPTIHTSNQRWSELTALHTLVAPQLWWHIEWKIPDSLRYLEVDNIAITSLKGSSIETLVIHGQHSSAITHIKSLPSSLTHLSVSMMIHLSDLKPTVTTLEIKVVVTESFLCTLPASITRFMCDSILLDSSMRIVQSFPRDLKKLGPESWRGKIPQTYWSIGFAVEVLAQHWVTSLQLSDIVHLPDTVESIELCIQRPAMRMCCDEELPLMTSRGLFPPSLTLLDLGLSEENIPSWAYIMIPRTVVKLIGPFGDADALKDLPPNLTILSASVSWLEPHQASFLPRSLKKLMLNCLNILHEDTAACLPEGLETLHIQVAKDISIEALAALPRQLRSLWLRTHPVDASVQDMVDALPPTLVQLTPSLSGMMHFGDVWLPTLLSLTHNLKDNQ